jgi:hypothetical protein
VTDWFGSALAGDPDGDGDNQEVALEEGRFQSTEGCLWFGSAQLPKEWQDWVHSHDARESKDVLNSLFAFQSSTAISGKGVVIEHSLRVAEVAVPMELVAEVRGPASDQEWVKALEQAFPILRTLGSRRTRGYGRVDLNWEEKS